MKYESEGTRLPKATNGININFCKNPRCPNFGIPASTEKQPKGRWATEQNRDAYTVRGTLGHASGAPRLLCNYCNESPPFKSNFAIGEELKRMLQYLEESSITCPNAGCDNHGIDVRTDRSGYQAFGKTKAGSKRYRCKLCQATFIAGLPKPQHRLPHKNIQVFRLLVNKMPLKRICEAADISMATLYDKIDFIHQQCLAFAASRERKLLDGMPIRRLYVAVDRQDYLVNWSQTKDKRNVVLSAVGSADNTTGYVFGLHLNFDPSLQWMGVERDAIESGDYEKRHPFRKYARLWLQEDYQDAMSKGMLKRFTGKSLDREIEETYQQAVERDDVEVSESVDETVRLPGSGMQVHSEYTLYGHFFFLRQLFSRVEKVRFFLDQESGIRAACLSAFVNEIKEARCDAFYVRINKDLTIDEKKKAVAESRKEWNLLKRAYPKLSDSELKLLIIKERMKTLKTFGKWQDRWLDHPFPKMNEPEKAVCYLTDTGQYDEDHIAWLYNKASLHSIDRFFMQARRRVSLLERPISTPSSMGRRWYGYSPYNPGIITKVLDIFRIFYNFVEVGKDKETPAIRIGLSKGKVTMEDILYYQP
jgi:transposase-like protein